MTSNNNYNNDNYYYTLFIKHLHCPYRPKVLYSDTEASNVKKEYRLN